MTTQAQARDDILALVKGVADANSLTVIYDNNTTKISTNGASWIRASLRHTLGDQETLGGSGERRFSRKGLIFVQIFVPFGKGMKTSDTLSVAFRNAFEGIHTTNGVAFSGVRVNEVGQDGDWHQTNVVAEFTYEEVR